MNILCILYDQYVYLRFTYENYYTFIIDFIEPFILYLLTIYCKKRYFNKHNYILTLQNVGGRWVSYPKCKLLTVKGVP